MENKEIETSGGTTSQRGEGHTCLSAAEVCTPAMSRKAMQRYKIIPISSCVSTVNVYCPRFVLETCGEELWGVVGEERRQTGMYVYRGEPKKLKRESGEDALSWWLLWRGASESRVVKKIWGEGATK